MTEQPKQPEEKRSFVDPKDVPREETPNTSPITTIKVEGKDVHLLKPEVALTLIYGRLSEIKDELKMLNSVFSKASEPKTFVNPVQPTASNTPPAQSTAPLVMPPPATEQTPRVKEILAALEPVKDILIIDTESSAMFVMVKPSSFLGPENFAKVAQIIRSIGGQYVSAGKNTHFEIPKAPLRK
jgi:hypothetical protein